MIILLDTETNCLENPRVIEAALGVQDSDNNIELYTERFNPGVPISTKASAIHDIVDNDIAGLPTFKDSKLGEMYMNLNTPENYMVAHNAPFDLQAINNEGIDTKMQVIDTLRCCKHILADTICEEYNLQYLKYYLKLNEDVVPESLQQYAGKAHGAAADVVTLYLLFKRMVSKYGLSHLIELSNKTIIYNKMPFGKYKGELILKIVNENRGYANWALKNIEDKDIQASFKYYVKVANNRGRK